jgi:hypothetical protein
LVSEEISECIQNISNALANHSRSASVSHTNGYGEAWKDTSFLVHALKLTYSQMITPFWKVTCRADTWPGLLRAIKDAGMRAAVAIKPGTPVEDVFPLVSDLGIHSLNFREQLEWKLAFLATSIRFWMFWYFSVRDRLLVSLP